MTERRSGEGWEVLSAYWADCERRLYPLAASNPDGYMEGVRLVRAVADALAGAGDLDDLAGLWADRDALARSAAETAAANADAWAFGSGSGLDAAVGAGFSLRANEIRAERAEADRLERIAAARRDGLEWAVLHESGDTGSGLADPYRCVELHLGTGLAVVVSAEAEPSTLTASFVVSVVALDSGDGPPPEAAAAFEERRTSDAAELPRCRREMRRLVAEADGVLGRSR